jgi:hypothetical protein
MKKIMTTAAVVATLSELGRAEQASNYKMNYQEALSFKAPLQTAKFDHWQTEEASVFLSDRIILTP